MPEVAGLGLVLEPRLDGVVEGIGVGFPGDVADRPGHAALAVERALRTFEHLDALQVEVRQQRLAGARALHRDVVHVHRDRTGRGSELRDSARRDSVPGLRGVAVVQSWNRQEQVLDVLDAALFDVDVSQRRDGQRRVHQLRVAVRGGDHDLLDHGTVFGRSFVVGLGRRWHAERHGERSQCRNTELAPARDIGSHSFPLSGPSNKGTSDIASPRGSSYATRRPAMPRRRCPLRSRMLLHPSRQGVEPRSPPIP